MQNQINLHKGIKLIHISCIWESNLKYSAKLPCYGSRYEFKLFS